MRRSALLCVTLMIAALAAAANRAPQICRATIQLVDAETGESLSGVVQVFDADGERLLSSDERDAIEFQMQELRDLLAGTDGAAIEQQTKRRSQVTDAFAARRLDSTVKAALAGRNLNEIEE